MDLEKNDSEKTFLANLRESLGVPTAWKMAQRLKLPFTTFYNAEIRGGIPSDRLLRALVKEFGWEKLGNAIKKELKKDA